MLLNRPPSLREILTAQAAIAPHVFRTPLRHSVALSASAQVWLKLENWQPTGSFKVRGAVNFLVQLSPGEQGRGFVTASAGNHALAVGYAAQQVGVGGVTVFVPCSAPRSKVAKLKQFPVTVREVGETYADAHHAAEEFERTTGATFVHAFDDMRTAAGAGTIGLEILQDLPGVDALLVPVGGGGLIAGVAVAAKTLAPQVKVYGVQPEASPALRDSLRDGRCYFEYPAAPTICDGLAGGIGRIGFEAAQKYVDDVLVVPEASVRRAVTALARDEQLIVEGSGAVGLAALERPPRELEGKRVALVVTGANLDAPRLAGLLEEASH